MPKRQYKEAKLKQVLKACGHKASDVDKEKPTDGAKAKQTLKKLLRLSDERWTGLGVG